jgi:hypothetical protein
MKKVFIFLALMLPNYGSSQSGISKEELYPIFSEFDGYQVLYKHDSIGYSFMYKNDDFQTITQFEYIRFNNLDEVVDFFNIVLEVANKGIQYNLDFNDQNYRIERHAAGVYVFPPTGYFSIRKNHVVRLLNFIGDEK